MSTPSIVACPNCKTQLRRPQGNAERIRCPQCQTVLKIGAAPVNPVANPIASPPATKPAAASIVIRCGSCGTQMKVAASSAGKKARCPKCQTVTDVPVSGLPTSPNAAANGPPPPPVPAAPTGSHFDDLPPSPFPDPLAAAPGPLAAAPGPLTAAPGGAAGASPFSQPLASAPAANPYAPTSDTTSGLSGRNPPPAGRMWALVGITALVSFLVPMIGMITFPPLGLIAVIFGYGGGMIGSSIAGIWLLVLAFQDDVGQGLLCLFVPFYILYYMFKEWQTTWLPSMIYWISAVAMFGSLMGMILGAVIAEA